MIWGPVLMIEEKISEDLRGLVIKSSEENKKFMKYIQNLTKYVFYILTISLI